MAFKFRITNITKLKKQKLIVLDGEIISGSIQIGDTLYIHDNKEVQFKVVGVVIKNKILSISVECNESSSLLSPGKILF